jgi:hypothetical protein
MLSGVTYNFFEGEQTEFLQYRCLLKNLDRDGFDEGVNDV